MLPPQNLRGYIPIQMQYKENPVNPIHETLFLAFGFTPR